MPLFRRLPKRGFSNFQFRREFSVVNVGTLNERFADGDTVDPDALRKLGLIRGLSPIRILGNGKLTKRLTVKAHAFSARARQAIEQASGRIEPIQPRSAAQKAAIRRRAGRGKREGGQAATGPERAES